MIGGGSRGKDRGQWDGWGLGEASKRLASLGRKDSISVMDLHLGDKILEAAKFKKRLKFKNQIDLVLLRLY